ncbi:MAG: hypothetical protein H7Y43_01620 [Akkermansiaceae bacterium]|nr:hypothetical protein [Verrucomicrobiales bacterium]
MIGARTKLRWWHEPRDTVRPLTLVACAVKIARFIRNRFLEAGRWRIAFFDRSHLPSVPLVCGKDVYLQWSRA